jgi:hypothetical protein
LAGINRALYEDRHFAKVNEANNKPCIFLSHIAVDKAAAAAIGKYIRVQGDIDIYLDIEDEDLQEAVRTGDPVGITEFIEKGLDHATHIMCLVSKATAASWWVPYEPGFGKNGGKSLSSLKLIGQVTLPSYLEIGEIIHGTDSLNRYLTRVRRGLSKNAATTTLTETLIRSTASHHPLDDYLDFEL